MSNKAAEISGSKHLHSAHVQGQAQDSDSLSQGQSMARATGLDVVNTEVAVWTSTTSEKQLSVARVAAIIASHRSMFDPIQN